MYLTWSIFQGAYGTWSVISANSQADAQNGVEVCKAERIKSVMMKNRYHKKLIMNRIVEIISKSIKSPYRFIVHASPRFRQQLLL